MEKSEYRYQWSSKQQDGEILVVRADTTEELEIDIEWARILIGGKRVVESHPERAESLSEKYQGKTVDEIDPADLDDSFCTVHKVKMKERDGKNGKFFSHARQLDDESWDWCSGQGYKSER